MERFLLWLCALAFTGYGLACLLDPSIATGNAGLSILNSDGHAEISAMYGGLQTGFGIFCALAALRPTLIPAACLLLALTITPLFLARLATTLTAGGVGSYTLGALGFEAVVAALACICAWRQRSRGAT
jgi:hypothetical protein